MNKHLFNILCFLIYSFPLPALIIECQQLEEILPYVEQDTLVVFNINNVLTVSYQDAGSTPWAEEQIALLMKEKGESKPHATNLFIPLWHDILVSTDVELFDPHAEAIILHLQQKGIKTIALTNRYTEMAYSTHRNLRSVGIDFAKNALYPEDCWIEGANSPSKYIEGIIFNGLLNFKGDTLVAFLKQINYFPKKLIYIEDKPKHLSQVGDCVDRLGIPFIGVHFGALELQREAYNADYANLQVKFHYDILDDTSAKKLCYNHNALFNKAPIEKVEKLPEYVKAIHSFKEIDSELTEKTLLVTELDHVLWRTQASVGSRPFYHYYLKKLLCNGFSAELAQKTTERVVEKIYRRAHVNLIENDTPVFLNQLMQKNVWSVGISYRPHSLLSKTIYQANELKIHFNSPFNNEIICSNTPAGQFITLEKELRDLAILPNKIVAVSCDVKDLKNLKNLAQQLNLPFQGYLFELQQEILMDEKILNLQLECLDRLLTNSEAKILFNL